jgi:hypothetical protein
VSDLQNEFTPGVYYESSKTLRELMMRQLSMGGKKAAGFHSLRRLENHVTSGHPPGPVSEIMLVVLEFETPQFPTDSPHH